MNLTWELFREYGRTLVEALVGCCFLAATWAARRTQRWLLELLERERLAFERQRELQREREIQRHNETLRTFAEASAIGEQPTLGSLLASAERDWSLESSPEPFVPPHPAPPPRPSSAIPEPTDWSDDDLPTTTPPPRSPRNG